jgi:hypothetical protein
MPVITRNINYHVTVNPVQSTVDRRNASIYIRRAFRSRFRKIEGENMVAGGGSLLKTFPIFSTLL